MFLILNYSDVLANKIEDISQLEFLSSKNEKLKKIILSLIANNNEKTNIKDKIDDEYSELIKEIKENSNIQIIIKNKTEEEINSLLDELIQEFREQKDLKKIESLENELLNNLDESSYSELLKLKNQLNRD